MAYELLPTGNEQKKELTTDEWLETIPPPPKKESGFSEAGLILVGLFVWIAIIYTLYRVFRYIKLQLLNNKTKETIQKEADVDLIEFMDFFKCNIAVTREELDTEHDFLLKAIKSTKTLPELDGAFNDIKDHIKYKINHIPPFKNQESINAYIKQYREMFASLKKCYEDKLKNITEIDKSFIYNEVDECLEDVRMEDKNNLNNKEKSYSIVQKIGYVLLLAVMFFIFKGLLHIGKSNGNEYSIEQELKQIVAQNAHLYPIVVDSTVRADKLSSNGNSLVFSYTITSYSANEALNDFDFRFNLYGNALINSCNNGFNLLKQGGSIIHVYFGNDGKHVNAFTINSKDCDKAE